MIYDRWKIWIEGVHPEPLRTDSFCQYANGNFDVEHLNLEGIGEPILFIFQPIRRVLQSPGCYRARSGSLSPDKAARGIATGSTKRGRYRRSRALEGRCRVLILFPWGKSASLGILCLKVWDIHWPSGAMHFQIHVTSCHYGFVSKPAILAKLSSEIFLIWYEGYHKLWIFRC